MAIRALPRRRRLSVEDHVDGVLAGNRTIVGRTISLVESDVAAHRDKAQQVLLGLLPHTGEAHRIGITGVPGVGKSTFIDQFGLNLIDDGHKVAVLAVDPTSSLSRGSILGDKTRMERLSVHDSAFIRPSPTGGSLGGVNRKTRETILVCEAAGYNRILVETVGVGQSETLVAGMVDVFVLLMLPGAGDELQGIKRGIMERADILAVNKADGDNANRAKLAGTEYRRALHYLQARSEHWTPPVLHISGLHNIGLDSLAEAIEDHRRTLRDSGELAATRQAQQKQWTWDMVEERLIEELHGNASVAARAATLDADLAAGRTTPTLAAVEMLRAFGIEA